MERKPEYLEDWWAIITPFEKVMWVIAAISALIFMFQVFLFFNKFLGSKRRSREEEIGYYNFWDSLLSFQNIIVFFTFFSWATLTFFGEKFSISLSLLYGTLVGIVISIAFAYLFYYYETKDGE